MHALFYLGTESLAYRRAPDPVPSDGQSLVRITAAGICGSDMHAYHGLDARRVPPMILGHELAGTVESGPLRGQRVAINPMLTCHNCRECLAGNPNRCQQRDLLGLGQAGGFANLVTVDSRNLYTLPDDLSLVDASLMEPTAVSVHAVVMAERALTRPLSECRVLVIGGGAIGLLAALIVRNKGARSLHVAETNAPRRETLKQLDTGIVFDPLSGDQPSESTFDLVIDAVGSGATRAMASALVRAGGVISHVGLQDDKPGLDTRKLTLQEVTFIGHYTYSPIDLKAALDLIHRGALGPLDWVEQQPLSKGADAFRSIHTGTAASPKIVLLPSE
ncbi:MAG: alcohol dehydrogenase catalytic domain-containing protein [Granulosicoccaceae bacterium]